MQSAQVGCNMIRIICPRRYQIVKFVLYFHLKVTIDAIEIENRNIIVFIRATLKLI
jgi:hypothetical protein